MSYTPPPTPPPGGYGPPGYGPPGYGPPGYGQPPGYGYGGYPAEHPQGTTILVLGVLSLVVCGVLGPVAWTMGNTALKQINANPGAYTNRGNVQAGRICGMIGTALVAIGILAFVLLMAVGMASSSSSSGY